MINELYNRIKEQDRFSDVFKPISKEEREKRDREKIEDKLKEGQCTLNPDGSYSCEGDVNLCDMGLTKIPVRFKEVGGDFYCYYNKLKTLEGAPESVGGNFSCGYNNLNTLDGAPEKVGGYFSCRDNKLNTLEGAPEKVGGNFYCDNNNLNTLEGAPKKVGGDFYFSGNPIAFELGIYMISGSELQKYVK